MLLRQNNRSSSFGGLKIYIDRCRRICGRAGDVLRANTLQQHLPLTILQREQRHVNTMHPTTSLSTLLNIGLKAPKVKK